MEDKNKEIFKQLIHACKAGNLNDVKKYLNEDNIEGNDSYTPVKGAIALRRYEILEYLLSKGANQNRMLPLHLEGMCNEYLPIIHTYSTYLHYAIYKEVDHFEFQNSNILFGHPNVEELYIPVESLKILIKYGADINKKNEKGETPLDMALCSEHHTAREYLKSLGAKTSAQLEQENK